MTSQKVTVVVYCVTVVVTVEVYCVDVGRKPYCIFGFITSIW